MASPTPIRTASETARQVDSGALTPAVAVSQCLDRIADREPDANAFVTVLDDEARDVAAARAEAGSTGPLHGVPVALKDLSAYKAGVRHTFGAKPFAAHVADRDAILTERLEAAGAIVVGKTNTPEFGHKGTTDNMLVGATPNPFAPDRIAGGSSGGSAAAVAEGMVPAAQGSDAAGSVRVPAAACGVYGFKPTFGRIPQASRPDAFAAHAPFSDPGPITRTVEDAALLLSVMAGPHPADPHALPDDGSDFLAATGESVDHLTAAYTPDLGLFSVDPRVRRVVGEAADAFAATGAAVDTVELDFDHSLEDVREALQTLLRARFAGMAEDLARQTGIDLLDHREDLPSAVLDRVETGRETLAPALQEASRVRTSVLDTVRECFERYDLLLSPVMALPPFPLDEFGPTSIDGDPVHPHLGWQLTYVFNLTGHPAASVPAGFTSGGLPVGMQVVAPRFADERVLAASAAFERESPWHDTLPPS